MYYGHAAYPRAYAWNWRGVPQGSQRGAVSRGLGHYDTFPVSMSEESGRRSVLHAGPEQTHIHDAPNGLGKLSDNERRYMTMALVGGAVYFGYKMFVKKGKKRR